MRQEQGLDAVTQDYNGRLTVNILASLLLDDLRDCQCSVFGEVESEKTILLATLHIVPESLEYESYSQRIEFIVKGEIINNDSPPLTYKVEGDKYSFYGRCSTVFKVCGVDLYLSRSYTEQVGDRAQQKFTILVKKLMKSHF
ncbi:MAG: hypothetical protein KAH20_12450 [Methylococcales bacterium]|nr:hypothetical protein [Methylococcales bacterium]